MKDYIKGLVSVVIPTYGRSETLQRAIESVVHQTYQNTEILVVDDNEPGSEISLEVKRLIDSLGYPNLKLVTQERHINGAAARNAGIRVAKGEYIALLDDDDFFLPEKLEMQVRFLETLDESFGGVSSRKVYIRNGKIEGTSDRWRANKKQNFDIISRKLNVSTCTLLLRHRCLDETGYFDERLRRHQEIQLLAFFTSKYKVELLDELLTVIDCTDTANRPDSEKILGFKRAYLEAIEPILGNYSKHRRSLVVAHNMTEVARVCLREKEYGKACRYLFKSFLHPSVFGAFIQLIFYRVFRRNSKRGIDEKTECAVQSILNTEVE